jgi:transcriptional regulator with XRE-family HTH domain
MKMKVGTRLFTAREDRKLTQAEMADLLGVSSSTYARIERNETTADLEQISGFAKILQIPIQEFLPDTICVTNSSHQNNQNAQGLVLGNIYNYNYSDKDKEQALLLKDQEVSFLKEKITLLETSLTDLRNTVTLLQKDK